MSDNASSNDRIKRTAISLEQKVEICQKLENGIPVNKIADEYHIHPTTVRCIRRNGMKMYEYASQGVQMLKRKRMRRPDYEDLDIHLHTWFWEQSALGKPVTNSLLREKALEFSKQFKGSSTFKASPCWLMKFKKRHGIELLDANEAKECFDASRAREVDEEGVEESDEREEEETIGKREYKEEEQENHESFDVYKGELEMYYAKREQEEREEDIREDKREREIQRGLEILRVHTKQSPRYIKLILDSLESYLLYEK